MAASFMPCDPGTWHLAHNYDIKANHSHLVTISDVPCQFLSMVKPAKNSRSRKSHEVLNDKRGSYLTMATRTFIIAVAK